MQKIFIGRDGDCSTEKNKDKKKLSQIKICHYQRGETQDQDTGKDWVSPSLARETSVPSGMPQQML